MAINKQTLKYLAELGRIELKEKSEDKLLKDIQVIFDYFEELKEADTEGIEPMACLPVGIAGGTIEKNIFREDKINGEQQDISDKLIDQFPEKEGEFLKVPPVLTK